MKFYHKMGPSGKIGKKYHPAKDAEIFLAALEIMRNHPRLKGVATHIETEMVFGRLSFEDGEDGEDSLG